LLSYLVSKDTADEDLLTDVRHAAASAVAEALRHSRAGEADARWMLCQRVLDDSLKHTQGPYDSCRALIAAPQPEDTEAAGDVPA